MKVAIIGTGTMGNGITQTFATAGHDVIFKGRRGRQLQMSGRFRCPWFRFR